LLVACFEAAYNAQVYCCARPAGAACNGVRLDGREDIAMDTVERLAADAGADAVIKDWMLKRNCSVSPRQFVLFYLSLATFSFAVALLLLLRGVWMVLPFTGIEVLSVGVAFIIYGRHAVDYEYIRLFPHLLVIEQKSAEQVTRFEFNPRWVRVDPGTAPRDRITLHSGGRSVEIGQYVALHRRALFARELRVWLGQCGG
jgi:uncharacterized membrane protein